MIKQNINNNGRFLMIFFCACIVLSQIYVL